MEKLIDTYNLIAGTLIALLTAIFGQYYLIFILYLVCNVLDWLTGWAKSRKFKTESSKEGFKGVLKKTGYWVIIAVAFLIPITLAPLGELIGMNFDFLNAIGWVTLASLLVNEARSILENLVELGYNVPTFLIKGLAITDEMINNKEKNDNRADIEREEGEQDEY